MSETSSAKRLSINIVAQLIAFVVNIGIGFFLTPYIIKTVGSTAYGFVGLANNFVSYVQILITALNSMAGRFIAISFYKEDYENVKKYYTSVLFANLFLSLVISVPCTLLLIFINKVVDVPNSILFDVRILWALIFGAMLVSIIGSIFSNAAYVKNRLELISLRNIESNVLRAVILIGAFSLLVPKVWYVGLATFISGVYVIFVNMYYTKKLMPMVKIKRKYFDFSKIKELVSSGVWNSVSQLGNVLSTGLDLLITNLFVGADPMGIVAISKTIPTYIQSLFVTVANVFAPQLTISFAKDDNEGMKSQLLFAMKLMGLFASIPVSFIVVFGKAFYQLWTPTKDAKILVMLTIVTVLEYPISLIVYPLENIFATLNKVKSLSIITIITALCSCGSVFILLQFTDNVYLKMLIVVGVSTFFNIIKNGIVVPIYCSRFLNIKFGCFGKIILKSIISTVIMTLIIYAFGLFFTADSWIKLIFAALLVAIFGFMLNFVFILSRNDKEAFLKIILKKLHR